MSEAPFAFSSDKMRVHAERYSAMKHKTGEIRRLLKKMRSEDLPEHWQDYKKPLEQIETIERMVSRKYDAIIRVAEDIDTLSRRSVTMFEQKEYEIRSAIGIAERKLSDVLR